MTHSIKKAGFALLLVAGAFWTAAAQAETTVTVSDDNNVAVQRSVATPVLVQQQPVVLTEDRAIVQDIGDYDLVGEIVNIDHPNSEILVRYTAEKRLKGDPGIVHTLKTGDRVKVKLRGGWDSKEAFRIVEV